MAERIDGLGALNKRLNAIGDPRLFLHKLQLDTVAEAKRLVPRKTGNLGRSIQPGLLGRTDALVVAQAGYARYVEEGTGLYGPKHRRIEPGKVMRWANPGGATLGGRVRSKNVGLKGAYIFATSTQGAKPQPFLLPGAQKAIKDNGVDIVVELWNGAA